jgi:hypothetical protein
MPPRLLAVLALALASSVPRPAASEPAHVRVSRAQLVDAMRARTGYDPLVTTNAGRFSVEVLLALAEAAEREKIDRPLFIDHEEWFQALLEISGLTADDAPLFAKLAREYKQDTLLEHRTDRIVERVVKGPAVKRALAATVSWPASAGKPSSYSFQDLLARPTLQVTNQRTLRYRVLVFEDRIFVDQIEGLGGRPNSGALGLLFKLIGEGRVLEYRMALSPDGVQVSRGRAKKAFFEVASTITVQPDGKAEKDVPKDRPDLAALERRLQEPLEIRYRPLALDLY